MELGYSGQNCVCDPSHAPGGFAAVWRGMDGSVGSVEGGHPTQRNVNGVGSKGSTKTTKKSKKAVLFFEVEILDAKTREKLCFLDKVRSQIRREGMLGWPFAILQLLSCVK